MSQPLSLDGVCSTALTVWVASTELISVCLLMGSLKLDTAPQLSSVSLLPFQSLVKITMDLHYNCFLTGIIGEKHLRFFH